MVSSHIFLSNAQTKRPNQASSTPGCTGIGISIETLSRKGLQASTFEVDVSRCAAKIKGADDLLAAFAVW